MTPRRIRTVVAAATDKAERRARAIEFWQSAEDLSHLGADPNSVVTLYVLAGIAASDAICCATLGEYSQSENHVDALAVLARADPSLRAPLQRLLSRKSEAAYGAHGVSAARVLEARKAAERLVGATRLV